jgi:hypothetical protein
MESKMTSKVDPQDEDVITIISRSIGRTALTINHRERALDVVRSLQENDKTIPKPTSIVDYVQAAIDRTSYETSPNIEALAEDLVAAVK